MDIPKNPIIALGPYLNSRIEVSLVNNTIITGTLVSYDKYSNMIIEAAKERSSDSGSEVDLSVVYVKGRAVR